MNNFCFVFHVSVFKLHLIITHSGPEPLQLWTFTDSYILKWDVCYIALFPDCF